MVMEKSINYQKIAQIVSLFSLHNKTRLHMQNLFTFAVQIQIDEY